MKLIDKDALVAEIERRIKTNKECMLGLRNLDYYQGKVDALNDTLSSLDTLVVKEVDEELQGIEKEVAEGYVARINRKRIPIELKGEIKAKFKNEFHTIWQIVNGMQFANVAKYIIERICLHFATWGAYHLKDYIGMSDEEKAKIDSMKKEPVSEDLEAAMQHNAPNNIGIDDLLYWRNGFIAGAKWQKEKEYTCYEEAFEDGAKWKVENLWKPADGDDFPEIDREVVAFQEIFPTDVDVPSLLKIVIAHRPNPEGYDGKSIATGIVEHYTPKTYGEGGWNIPDVRFWLDVKLPKEIEL